MAPYMKGNAGDYQSYKTKEKIPGFLAAKKKKMEASFQVEQLDRKERRGGETRRSTRRKGVIMQRKFSDCFFGQGSAWKWGENTDVGEGEGTTLARKWGELSRGTVWKDQRKLKKKNG